MFGNNRRLNTLERQRLDALELGFKDLRIELVWLRRNQASIEKKINERFQCLEGDHDYSLTYCDKKPVEVCSRCNDTINLCEEKA